MKHSIIIRYGLIMAVIIALTMMGVVSSALIAESIDQDAARINLAGSLRMQSYKISQSLLLQDNPQLSSELGNIELQVQHFEDKLNKPVLSLLEHHSPSHPLYISYRKIKDLWQPLKNKILNSHETAAINATQVIINDFVLEVDQLVKDLQVGSESKIRLLRTLQGAILFSTLITAFLALYNLSSNVVDPLRRMVLAADKIRKGDFKSKIHYEGEDELSVLANSINKMSEALSESYSNLEAKVAEKTQGLKNTNSALELLYQTSMSLHKDAYSADQIQQILEQLEASLGSSSIKLSICLTPKNSYQAFHIGSVQNQHAQINCIKNNCESCPSLEKPNDRVRHSFSIGRAHDLHGELLAEHDSSQELKEWQKFILHNFADILATSLSHADTLEQERYLALMEERAVIARELHDSLAQSLSYLKIQAARLETLKKKGHTDEKQLEAISDIRTGLNNSYRQLRELLTTFRLQIQESGLKVALQGTVAEFSEKAAIPITLSFNLDHVPLSPNEEIHTLQIVREALSNVNRHAQAQSAEVIVEQDNNNGIVVTISDNGNGLLSESASGHYGTIIMNERAASLGGEVVIQNNPHGGVSVILNYQPAFLKGQSLNIKAENYEPLRYIQNPTH